MKASRIFTGLFVALTLAGAAQTVMAQSTIFNIPTTDTVDKGKAYAEFDFLAQAPGFPDSRLYIYNPRLVVGVAKNLEAGVNFPTSRISGSTSGYIQPNIKYKYYNNDDAGIAMAGGAMLNTPLNNRSVQDSWAILYTEASKKFKGDHGPRLHAGPYGIVSANQDALSGPVSFVGPRAGAILGYEQPVHSRVSFVADWFSGKNFFGYFTPGASISLPGSGLFNIGYSIGNDSWADSNATKNRSLFVYYGVTF